MFSILRVEVWGGTGFLGYEKKKKIWKTEFKFQKKSSPLSDRALSRICPQAFALLVSPSRAAGEKTSHILASPPSSFGAFSKLFRLRAAGFSFSF
jgi:hypothetical protein